MPTSRRRLARSSAGASPALVIERLTSRLAAEAMITAEAMWVTASVPAARKAFAGPVPDPAT